MRYYRQDLENKMLENQICSTLILSKLFSAKRSSPFVISILYPTVTLYIYSIYSKPYIVTSFSNIRQTIVLDGSIIVQSMFHKTKHARSISGRSLW